MTDAADLPLALLDEIGQRLDRIAEELAFATPGSDAGLLPVNALVMDLEEVGAGLPLAFRQGVAIARRRLDDCLDGACVFDAASIDALGVWHGAFVAWLEASARGEPPPPWPESLGVAGGSAPEARPAAGAAAAPPVAAAPGETVATFTLNLPADRELLGEFHAESLELLQQIEQSVLRLEDNPGEREAVNAIFRAFHTFKGSAGFLKLDALQRLAHDLESLLELVRSGALAVGRGVIDAILRGADVLADCTRRVGAQVAGQGAGTPVPVPIEAVRAAIARAMAPPNDDPVPTPEPAQAPAVPAGAAAREAGGDGATVRVDAGKLDDFVNLVGELVIAQSILLDTRDGSDGLVGHEREEALQTLKRITRELRRNAISMRMVPVGGLFRKMTRLVRDTAASVAKKVHLELSGEETELDRQLVDKMGDPLIHMIRNAVDHGIEAPDERLAAGKPAVGTVRLSASHERGGVVIRIADDGRGIDGARLERKAIELGLLDPASRLDRADQLELMFLPGLSTAASVSDLSGRGVGMDVVRRDIESLRGTIDIASQPGRGTTFSIRLPLTLALIDGLLVRVGRERYVLPSLSVRECFRPEATALSTIHEQGEVVDVRGRQVPVLRLAGFLGHPTPLRHLTDGIMILIESAGAARALWVDALVGKQEMIIKTLGPTFVGNPLVVGGAVLGDGTVGLILSVDALVRAEARA